MLVSRTPVASPSSRGLLCHPPTTILGAFARQGGAVVRCCALPNAEAKKKASLPAPAAQIINVKGGAGGVHFHIHGAGQATEWDAVPISAEAKALLQKHAVKASTALKMHTVLGFEDVADLHHLSPGLITQLELRPLQLEPLARLLFEQQQQQQQDMPLVDPSLAQDQQQDTGQAQLAGHATPPGDEPPLPVVQQAADVPPASAGSQQDAGEPAASAGAGPAARAVAPCAAPAAAARAALPGTGGHAFYGCSYPRQSGGGPRNHPCVAVLEGKPGTFNSVAITPDGRRAVTAGPGSELFVWDLQERSCVATLEGHTADVLAVAVTPDGCRAVSRSNDRSLRMWDLGTLACTESLVAETRSAALAITPDGRQMLYGARGRLNSWAFPYSWVPLNMDCYAEDTYIECIAVTQDGRLAVTGGSDVGLCVWDLVRYAQAGALGRSRRRVTSVVITPDGRQAVSAAAHDDTFLLVHSLASRTCTGAMKEDAGTMITCLAITPDGRRVVSGSHCGLRVWDLATRTCTGVMEAPSSAVGCVAITPDGRYAVSGGRDLRVWALGPGPERKPAPAALQRLSLVLAAAAAAVGLK